MSTCQSCPAELIWAVTRNGKAIPVDAEPSAAANIRLVAREGAAPRAEVVMPADRREGEQLHTSHFATCPKATEHRRKR